MNRIRPTALNIVAVLVLTLGLTAPTAVAAFRINTIGLFGPDLVDGFQDLPVGQVAGVLVRNGFSVGESFVGQTVQGGEGAGFESILGSPTAPLQLAVPAAGDGIAVTETIEGNRRLAGLASGTANDDLGEGATSFLFHTPASGFALSFSSDAADTMQLAAYDRNGALIDSLLVPRSVRPISFISNVQPVKGITITNTDTFGISVDFLQLELVPEPSAATLLVFAFLGLLHSRRRPVLPASPAEHWASRWRFPCSKQATSPSRPSISTF